MLIDQPKMEKKLTRSPSFRCSCLLGRGSFAIIRADPARKDFPRELPSFVRMDSGARIVVRAGKSAPTAAATSAVIVVRKGLLGRQRCYFFGRGFHRSATREPVVATSAGTSTADWCSIGRD